VFVFSPKGDLYALPKGSSIIDFAYRVHSELGLFVVCDVMCCVAVCCSVLQCVAVCCSVLQCVAVCRSALGIRFVCSV